MSHAPLTHDPAGREYTTPAVQTTPARDADIVTLADLLRVVVRWKWLVILTPAVLLVMSLYQAYRQPLMWASTTTFVSQGGAGGGGALSGLAAQFGVSAQGAGADPFQSPAFYGDLLRSKTILDQIVDSATIQDSLGRRRSIKDAFGIEVRGPVAHPDLVLRDLARNAVNGMFAMATTRTGIMSITVRSTNPSHAYQLCGLLLKAVLKFNEEHRQSSAAAERKFAQERQAAMREELDSAEVRLRDFLSRNRGGGAPELQYEKDRLQREVSIKQDIYTSIAQAYEHARIDEARDTPLVTVIDQPELAAFPDPRHPARSAVLAVVGGVILGTVLAFILEAIFARTGWMATARS